MAETERGPAEGGRAVRSDPPPEDLKRERDTFIQQFFRRGAQLSEELLGDIERLREQVRHLEEENARLRAQLASDGAIRDLLKKIEELEEEKRSLLAQSSSVMRLSEFERRFEELETELGNLGTMHVANLQLHAASSVRRALRNVRELLAQFLGAAQFAVYWEADGGELAPVSVEGLTLREARDLSLEDTPAGRAFKKNDLFVDQENDLSKGSVERPAAFVTLVMGSRRLGAIAIIKTLPQKTSFESADRELLKLLGTQAATAIVHAHHFSKAGKQTPTAEAFVEQED